MLKPSLGINSFEEPVLASQAEVGIPSLVLPQVPCFHASLHISSRILSCVLHLFFHLEILEARICTYSSP